MKTALSPKVNRQIQPRKTTGQGRWKFTLLLSVLIHGLGFLAAPYLFRSCNKKARRPGPREIVFNVEFPRKKTGLKSAKILATAKESVSKKMKVASVTQLPVERFIPHKKVSRREKTSKKPRKSTNVPKISAQGIAKSKEVSKSSKTNRQATDAVIPKGGKIHSPNISRQNRKQYVSSEIFSALDRISSGSGEVSIYNSSRGWMPSAPGEGSGCASGNCHPVGYIGRFWGEHYWRDQSGSCFKTRDLPPKDKCFKAKRATCPERSKGVKIFSF